MVVTGPTFLPRIYGGNALRSGLIKKTPARFFAGIPWPLTFPAGRHSFSSCTFHYSDSASIKFLFSGPYYAEGFTPDLRIPPLALPVQSSVPEPAPVLADSLTSRLRLGDFEESLPVHSSVLRDLPADYSHTLVAVFGRVLFLLGKVGH